MNSLRELFLLRDDVVFLNHGSFGACPRPVFEDYQRWQIELERQPVEFLGRRFDGLMREARTVLAEFVKVDADEIVFAPNATTAINIVARSLRLQPGDEILTTDHEYGAMDRTWQFLCAKNEATYTHVPIPLPVTTPADFVERFWSAVTPRTKIIFLSHITSPTALILPVAEICRRARERGIITIVDGAHALGQIPLDLKNLGADFYTSNAHKWLMAPKGCAFLYARREMQSLVEPLVVSWGWHSERPSMSRFVDEQEWTGTRDIAAYLSIGAAIKFFREHNWERVRDECHELLRYGREQIAAFTGLPPICPDSREWFAQLASCPLPACDADALKRRLYDEFRVEVPIVTWDKKQFVRVSIQGYNTREDVNELVQGLKILLPQVNKT